jgi:hypothetical protein
VESPSDQEVFEDPQPKGDLRPYLGKMIALDEAAVVRESADSWEALTTKIERLSQEELSRWTLMYLPRGALVA